MPKYSVVIGLPQSDYNTNVNVAIWLFNIHDKIAKLKLPVENVTLIPIASFPTNTARNQIVDQFLANPDNDFLFQADTDAVPPEDWFESALAFLVASKEARMIGCPYVGSNEHVMVHRWTTPDNVLPPKIECYPREEAATKTGIEEVANIGTHMVAYKRSCFEALEPPYYDYGYTCPKKVKVLETEDCWCHRRMQQKGVKVYCDWDRWSMHLKTRPLMKPHLYELKDIKPEWLGGSVIH